MTIDLLTAAIGFAIVAALGALGWLVRWAWEHTHKRIDDIDLEMGTKAPNVELTRVRDAQIAAYQQLRAHDSEDRARHTELVVTVGRVEGKVEALLNRERKDDRRGDT